MRQGRGAQLLFRLGQRDVEDRLAELHALEQVLKRERGLAGSRDTFDEVQAIRREAATQHVIEPGDARLIERVAGRARLRGVGH